MTAQIAEAQRIYDAAEAEHAEAMSKVRKIAERIEDCQQRQRAITQQRLEGEAHPGTAAEFAALGADIETLSIMLSAAQQAADAVRPDEARRQLMFAQQQHARDLVRAEFDALTAVAAKLDGALCRCVAELHRRGKQMGHVQLSQSWRPSSALDRCMRLGVAPEVA
jgi:chromosome segregation ATPase